MRRTLPESLLISYRTGTFAAVPPNASPTDTVTRAVSIPPASRVYLSDWTSIVPIAGRNSTKMLSCNPLPNVVRTFALPTMSPAVRMTSAFPSLSRIADPGIDPSDVAKRTVSPTTGFPEVNSNTSAEIVAAASRRAIMLSGSDERRILTPRAKTDISALKSCKERDLSARRLMAPCPDPEKPVSCAGAEVASLII